MSPVQGDTPPVAARPEHIRATATRKELEAMITRDIHFAEYPQENQGEQTWENPYELSDEKLRHLQQMLTRLLRGWIMNAGVASWRGQEYDLVEDVLQMALEKVIVYLQHLEKEAIPIKSLENLSIVIARNCFLDQRRHDRRLHHLSPEEVGQATNELVADPVRQVEEKIEEDGLLYISARVIATFPPKLQEAILTDLAWLSCFSDAPTPLQQAFREVGIDLQKYVRKPSAIKAERNKQVSLRSLAYKRLAQEVADLEANRQDPDIACIRESADLAGLAHGLQESSQYVAPPAFQDHMRGQIFSWSRISQCPGQVSRASWKKTRHPSLL